MEKHYKNFKFNDFYDKPFIDNFKALVKDENKFHAFLEYSSFSLDEFLHIRCLCLSTLFYFKSN